MFELKNKNNTIKRCLIILILAIALSVVFFVMYKYHVEGEQNLPFSVTKIITVSSAETDALELNDGLYQANVIQKNDIFLAIEKNNKYKKDDSIKKITFNNFNIIDGGKIGNLKIYRTAEDENTFNYTEDYELNKLEYFGDLNTNLKMEKMSIANQGGLLEFSMVLTDLGKITYGENENIMADGTLLQKLEINPDDIIAKVSFDMIIELSSGNNFKTTFTLILPCGNISEDGVCTEEDYNLDKIIYKRI